MSYNISVFKVKKLENLIIPLRAFYISPRKDWHPESRKHKDGLITLSGCDGEGVTGVMDGSMGNIVLKVRDVHICGEGSGCFMREIFEPALEKSTGFLTASCIWEEGDSISKLIAENGDIRWENIEI
jgi:hypothetical protein